MGVYKNLPCWLIFDQVWLDKYGFAGGLGGELKARTDWITSSDTLTGLADKLGIPGDVFEQTVARFNANAREFSDPDFNRGWSAQDQWWGDPTLRDGTARASLGPLDTPPYYAIQVFSGALGTKGGPLTDTRSRVHRRRWRRDPGSVLGRQRLRLAARHDVRRCGRHARTGDGVRFHRRAGHRATRRRKPAGGDGGVLRSVGKRR